MNRIFTSFLSFVLIICILFTFCFFPTAFAAESSSPFYDLLAVQTSDFVFRDKSSSLYFTLSDVPPYAGTFDLIVSSNAPISNVTCTWSPYTYSLYDLGNNFYRIIVTSDNFFGGNVGFRFYFSSYSSVFYVSSALFCQRLSNTVPAEVIYTNEGNEFSYIDSSGNVAVATQGRGQFNGVDSFNFDSAVDYVGLYNFEFRIALNIAAEHYKKYDYITFILNFQCNSISAVNARCGSINLPIELSFIDNFIYSNTASGDSTPEVVDSGGYSFKRVICTVDLSVLDPSNSDLVNLQISGSYPDNVPGGSFGHIFGIYGIFEPDEIEVDIVWYKRIYQTLLNIFNGDQSQNEAASNFQDEVSEQSSELESMTSVMNSVEKPEISEIDISSGSMVESSSLIFATTGISTLLSNNIIIRVVIMSLTFGLVGFILYGKK